MKNNRRHQETIENIEKAFVSLLRDSELNKLSVTELCEVAGIDCITFYANYEDVSALANEYAAKSRSLLKSNRIRMASLLGSFSISKQIKKSLSFISELVSARQREIT